MNSRERIKLIISGQKADRCGFWLGSPHQDMWPILLKYFNVPTQESLRQLLNDDFRHFCPQFYPDCYCHPQGGEMFPEITSNQSVNAGIFADCEDLELMQKFDWPNPDYLDFKPALNDLQNAGPYYRASSMWCCFYHHAIDLFGMENYMMKMHTHPEIVEAVTNHICEFYLKANERFFEQAGDLIDAVFFANDLGTQLSLMISPPHFDRFILPWLKKFVDQGHAHGYQVIYHSCGAVHNIINRFIDAGVDTLHPLQAKAAGMDAATLAKDFKGKITFMGGIDTQDILTNATPEKVKEEVDRVKALLEPGLIVSPSHESLLPNVPPENVEAMAEASVGLKITCDL